MSVRAAAAIGIIGLLSGGCTAIAVSDLDRRIAERKAEIRQLTTDVLAAAPPAFRTTRDVEIELRYRPLQAWLSSVSSPPLVIAADGVKAAGDVVYQGGVGKAWLEPAHDTRVRLAIRDLVLTPQAGALMWTASAQANAETRVRTYIFNVGSNVHCSGALPTVQPRGSFSVGQVQAMKLPYTMRFSIPGELQVSVRCGLGQLGSFGLGFPIGKIADSVSTGSIDLGIETAARIQLPAEAGGRLYVFRFSAQDAVVSMTDRALAVETNVGVAVE